MELRWTKPIDRENLGEIECNAFINLDDMIGNKAADLMFGKKIKIVSEKYGDDIDEFVNSVNLQSQLYKLEKDICINGGALVCVDINQFGIPELTASNSFGILGKDSFYMVEKIQYSKPMRDGIIYVKKTYTNESITKKYFHDEHLRQEIGLGQYIQLTGNVDEKDVIPNPFGKIFFKIMWNKPANSFKEASDTYKNKHINIAAQREILFAVADSEKSQSIIYQLGTYNKLDYDIFNEKVLLPNRDKFIKDKIFLVNSEDENGKLVLEEGKPQGKTYQEQLEYYIGMFTQLCGYSYKNQNANTTQSATEVRYHANGDVATTEAKKMFRLWDITIIVAAMFEFWYKLNKNASINEVDHNDFTITINPNYSYNNELLIKEATDKFKAGAIDLFDMIADIKQISREEAIEYVDTTESYDFINARIDTIQKLAQTNTLDNQTLIDILFKDISDDIVAAEKPTMSNPFETADDTTSNDDDNFSEENDNKEEVNGK